MKKFFLLVLIAFLSLAAILGLAAINANKLITQFKPQLEKLASEAIGTPIEFKDLTITFLPQSALKVSGFATKGPIDGRDLAQGPAFEELVLLTNLFSLLAGRLDINEIGILRPEITLVRSSTGISIKGLNLASRITSKTVPEENQVPAATPVANQIDAKNPAQKLKINLKRFELEKGVVRFEDQITNKSDQISALEITSKLAFSGQTTVISDFSLSGKVSKPHIPVSIQIPQLSINDGNLSVSEFTATVAETMFNGSTEFNIKSLEGNGSFKSSGIKLEQISSFSKELLPLSQYGLTGTVIPDFKIRFGGPSRFQADGILVLSQVSASQEKLSAADLNATLSINSSGLNDNSFKSKDLRLLLNGHSLNASFEGNLRNETLSLKDFAVEMSGGKINGDLNLQLNQSRQFNSRFKIKNLPIQEALSLVKADSLQLSGLLENMSANLSAGRDLKASLRGNAEFKISNGLLKGWNLPVLVLKALKDLPFLSEPLYSSLPASERNDLERNDTAFDSLDASLSFAESSMKANYINMRSDLFQMQSTGNIDFYSDLDLSCSLAFNPQFSASLAERVRELKNGFDERGQLVIPLKLKGKPPVVAVYPDLQKLLEGAGKKILIEKSTEVLKDVIRKKGLSGAFGF